MRAPGWHSGRVSVSPTRATSFAVAVRALGGRAGPHTLLAGAGDLERRWGDPGRGYHDLEHLDEVLDRLADLDAATPVAVLAAWFHDAVYAGRPGRDERDSADLARAALEALGVPADRADRVADLVVVTAAHVPADGDDEAAALCDADLAVLASPPQRYARYLAGVRHEYRHLPGPVFRLGRDRVLRRLLVRATEPAHPDGPLFRTSRGHVLWSAAAAANLRAELDR